MQERARALLPRRLSSALFRQGEQWTLRPDVIMDDAAEGLELKKELEAEGRRY
jgi:hypothetical protein